MTPRCAPCLLFVISLVPLIASCRTEAVRDSAEPPVDLPRIGSVERTDPRLDAIVSDGASFELIAEGAKGTWTEGPVWVPELGSVLYSEIPTNSIYRWSPGDPAPTLWLRPSGYTGASPRGGEKGSNGLAMNPKGQLVLAQHGDRRIARLASPVESPEPRFETLAARFQDKRFNSPNDLAVRRNGDVYFTDPPYGLEQGPEDPSKELEWQGVYRWSAGDDVVTLLIADLARPNGIVFSPDESVLYVASSDRSQPVIRAYDVDEDGGLTHGRDFYPSWGDGMTVDRQGNLYVAGPRNGVLVISPDGTLLGTLLGKARTSNCVFGDDGQTLYVTGVHVMRLRLKVTGAGF
ncbi:MAG: SMP-30/gluconolactonase/LRE family protein [Planctomycetota bacterium]